MTPPSGPQGGGSRAEEAAEGLELAQWPPCIRGGTGGGGRLKAPCWGQSANRTEPAGLGPTAWCRLSLRKYTSRWWTLARASLLHPGPRPLPDVAESPVQEALLEAVTTGGLPTWAE